MANDILKSCKKYVVQIIVSPSVYWITECESGKCHEKEMELFERLLSKHVVKFTGPLVSNGTVVAVEQKGEFFRGLVVDVFNRSSKITYSILLIDYGKMIETTKDKIYHIKSKKLKDQKSKALPVSVHGIQPAGLDINDKLLFNSIFQKRKCNKWLVTAFKFVEKLFEKNPYVFVKFISFNENNISGDFYFIQESDGMLVSLGQKLCEKGFAVLCDLPKFIIKHDPHDDKEYGIEEKIPENALFQNIETFKAFRPINDSSSHSSVITVNENDKLKSNLDNTLSKSNASNYSSSWILKKCQLTMTSPSDNSGNQKDICEFKQNNTFSSENSKGSLFRVAMKTMVHFDKQKYNPKSCHDLTNDVGL